MAAASFCRTPSLVALALLAVLLLATSVSVQSSTTGATAGRSDTTAQLPATGDTTANNNNNSTTSPATSTTSPTTTTTTTTTTLPLPLDAHPTITTKDRSVHVRAGSLRFDRLGGEGDTSGVPLDSFTLEEVGETVDALPQQLDDIVLQATQAFAAKYRLSTDEDRACGEGQVAQGIDNSGRLQCVDISPDFSQWQKRDGTLACGPNQAIRGITADGTVICENAAFTPNLGLIQARISGSCPNRK
jgi:hypothetical protein